MTGEEAARMVVAEGRKLAQSLSGARKANMQQLCDEVEQLTYQLGDMCRRGQVSHWRHLQATLSGILRHLRLFFAVYMYLFSATLLHFPSIPTPLQSRISLFLLLFPPL